MGGPPILCTFLGIARKSHVVGQNSVERASEGKFFQLTSWIHETLQTSFSVFRASPKAERTSTYYGVFKFSPMRHFIERSVVPRRSYQNAVPAGTTVR